MIIDAIIVYFKDDNGSKQVESFTRLTISQLAPLFEEVNNLVVFTTRGN